MAGTHTKLYAKAQSSVDTIHSGVYLENLDVSGMTPEEAKAAAEQYVEGLKDKPIHLKAVDDQEITVTAAELGIAWANPEVVNTACALGKEGNIVQRYKAVRDLEHENQVFPIQLAFDKETVKNVIAEKSEPFNKECIEATLVRDGNGFIIQEGQAGTVVDVDSSVNTVISYLTDDWNRDECQIALNVEVDEPKASKEDLAQVKDVLGTFTTSYRTSGSSRSGNVANGCSLVNGTTLFPGEEFSMYETVSPFSEDNGYYMAGSYLNGMVVDSLGGGICQVSTTLYNAVLLSELEVTERHNHSMIVSYVDPSADAAIAESSGKDFKFVNNTNYPIYIEGHTEDKKITFTIYGVETRPENRTVKYESEVLERIEPTTETIIASASQPIGFIDVQSAHIGYKAQLWKIVEEDGVEVSREQVNSSSYKMTPRTATVGTATADPAAKGAIDAAIATGSIDHVKAVAGAIVAANQQLAAQAEAAQQEAAAQAAQSVEQAAP
ncbi:MAG: hypothetical protein GX234_01155 [Clostridiales bacterium]|nr:hypothetical protein [Clostridiales bacterium]